MPKTNNYDANVPDSELLNPAAFSANPLALPPQAAKITGFGSTLLPDAAVTVDGTVNLPANLINGGTFTINGVNVTLDPKLLQEFTTPRMMYLWRGE
jgi:hypothetical protein